jgi:hypothetical protein
MKRSCKAAVALGFIVAVSGGTLCAQPYTFDENGNGFANNLFLQPSGPTPLPYEVVPDPTGGITGSPVLIYSLGFQVVSGDVALMSPVGNTISDLLRFFTAPGATGSSVIFYSQPDGTLAGSGIPAPINPVEITETSPDTEWIPNGNQPGAGVIFPVYARFDYTIITQSPEPSSWVLLLFAAVITWLSVRVSRLKKPQ